MGAYRDSRDGTWRYRKWVVLPSGIRTRITGTPANNTKQAAEHAERQHIARSLNPPAPTRAEVPFVRPFAEERFLPEYLPRQKPTERRSKEYILRGSLLPFFGDKRLDEIDQSLVNAYVVSLAELATKTVNNRLTVLSTLLRYAGPTGCKLIPETELRFHVASMSPDIVAVPASDVALLLAVATTFMRVAVLLAYEAGLRIGEIRGLQRSDICSGELTVRRSIDQHGNVTSPKHDKRRSVPLSPALTAALAALPVMQRSVWVLHDGAGAPMSYTALLEGIHALYTLAGVTIPVSETGVTMPWHSLRHTFGTECAKAGVPIPELKELMGHTSVSTTMRYVTVTSMQLKAAITRTFGAAPAAP